MRIERLSDPADDRILQEYLHRKSALSMGYKRVYIEEPPPELDRAVAARARRALRWLLPGILAAVIALGLLLGTSFGITKLVNKMVETEQTVKRIEKERKDQEEKERLASPVSVVIDSGSAATGSTTTTATAISREKWLAKIEQLKRTGTAGEVDAEIRRFHDAYPDAPVPKK